MPFTTATFLINGMTCQGCVASVVRTLKAIPGVADATVSLDDKCAIVQYDAAQTEISVIIAAVEDVGFDALMSSTES
jgi:copper chaperone